MLSTMNLLKPADGEPIVGPTKDMVLGVYYLTMDVEGKEHRGAGRAFADMDEVEMAYALDQVALHAPIRIKMKTWYDSEGQRIQAAENRIIDTTVGRVLFNRVLPEELRFVNRVLDKGSIQELVSDIYHLLREEGTPAIVDAIKDIGFAYATRSGTSNAGGSGSGSTGLSAGAADRTGAGGADYRTMATNNERSCRCST